MVEEKMFNSAFYIEDMTSLRYAVPFIKTAKRLLNEDVLLIYNDTAYPHKYNSIKNNYDRLRNVCEENEINLMTQREAVYVKRLKIKNLFCVESTAKDIEHENYFSFQHGFDYIGLHKNASHATYVVTEQYFKAALEGFGLKVIVQPTPVVFWDWDYHVKEALSTNEHINEKVAMMFYPEEGHHDIFKNIKDHLESLGYKTYIKQRRKNQPIPAEFENTFYDHVWYPSESIFLPMLSDVCVGFGTSAYTDLVHIDRDFIDLSIPDYSKNYYKPAKSNFASITNNFYENFCKLNLRKITLEEKLANPCNYEEIKSFLLQLII